MNADKDKMHVVTLLHACVVKLPSFDHVLCLHQAVMPTCVCVKQIMWLSLARAAVKRRSLAFDLHGLAPYSVLEGANEHLFDKLYIPCLPGTVSPSLTKTAEADREVWRLVIDECHATLKVSSDGSLPIGKAIEKLMYSPSVAFHLFPTPITKRARDEGDPKGSNPCKRPAHSPPILPGRAREKGKAHHVCHLDLLDIASRTFRDALSASPTTYLVAL